MKMTELLSPAKDKQTAFAAIDCGADAVYIGATSFGARQNAANSIEDIKEVVNYAHKYFVKVFVTVNTILTDKELEPAIKLIEELDKIGVDAILVQDMGLLKVLIEKCLDVPIHMSTQCDNRDIQKIEFFKNIGVSRVVLARELSLAKICEIHEKVPDIELETFVHGALCVSYSGQCYLSHYIGGRSANRGECAQPCRKKYSLINDDNKILAKDIYALCLKDFNASEHLKELVDSGVYSFKIEGRLKDINYVKNITAFYRQGLDKYSKKASSGRSLYNFVPNPEKSFNRGFTDYFLTGRKDCFNLLSPKSRGEYIGKVVNVTKNSIVVKTNKEIHKQDGMCFISANNIDGFIVNSVIQKPNGQLEIIPNKKIRLNTGDSLYRNADVEFEKLLNKKVKRQIGVDIEIADNYVNLRDEDGIQLKFPILSRENSNNQSRMNETFVQQFSKTGDSDFYIKNIKITSNIPFMPISEINNLRRSAFEKLMQKRLDSYTREVQKSMKFAKFYNNKLDYRANVHNNKAKEFYQKCGAEVKEMSFESSKPNRSIELMRTKHCIKYALKMCKSPQNLYLVDEFGVKYPLKFDCVNCEMCVMLP